jgi:hypothetical protein
MRLFLTYTAMFPKLFGSSALSAIFLLMTSFGPHVQPNIDPCSRVEVSITINDELNTATAEVKGGQAPIRYFFSDDTGELISNDYKSANVRNLKAGKYTCLVKEAGGCRKKIEFEIK